MATSQNGTSTSGKDQAASQDSQQPDALPRSDHNPEGSDAFENTPDFIGADTAFVPSPVEGDQAAIESDAGAGLAGFGVDGVDVDGAI
ncbi:hypothetical protein [Oecophyllibacter saccharovorans]|uniref:hypothetical protein n=1 Tax=Oecophyllibacter saccharovorans TaxID=2558360 RepID=UPI0011666231|nr:hypothetical protein [Oecophyllibacter saccharovorans]TPW35241.1 hypothetical protein E3203_07230 [Oecophyllibacter saccharovorans]